MLDGRIEKAVRFQREADDFIELAPNFTLAHPEDRTIEENIFAACELRMEACPNFQQAANPTIDIDFSHGWISYSSQDFEQSAFPSAIEANYAHNFAMSDFKTDILERPKMLAPVLRGAAVAAKGRKDCRSKRFSQRSIALSCCAPIRYRLLTPRTSIAVSLIMRICQAEV